VAVEVIKKAVIFDVWWAGKRDPDKFKVPDTLGRALKKETEFGCGANAVEALFHAFHKMEEKRNCHVMQKDREKWAEEAVKVADRDGDNTDTTKVYFVVVYFTK
jgi:hypothetical protein